MPAPLIKLPGQAATAPETETLADPLATLGYGERLPLFTAADIWSRMLQRLRPDAVVIDGAPALSLAARGQLPVFSIGSAYMVPPAGDQLPSIRPWQRVVSRRGRKIKHVVLEAANEILRQNRRHRFDSLNQWLRGDTAFIFADPAFDPYERADMREFIGPLERDPEVTSSRAVSAGCYIYLPDHPAIAAEMASALSTAGIASAVYLDNAGIGSGMVLPPDATMICGTPPALAEQLGSVGFVVHLGGLTFTQWALKAGVPQIIGSDRLERLANGYLAARQSAEVAVYPLRGGYPAKLVHRISVGPASPSRDFEHLLRLMEPLAL